MRNREITPSLLRELFHYEPETGKLYWLPRGREFFPDDRSYAVWTAQWPGTEALGANNGTGYKTGLLWGKKLRAHRVIWAMVHGEWPEQIDHINHDRSDNRLENLRSVTPSENCRNQSLQSNNTSGRTGVRYSPYHGKWIAQIWQTGCRKHLGLFATKDEAASAREAYERQNGYHKNHGT